MKFLFQVLNVYKVYNKKGDSITNCDKYECLNNLELFTGICNVLLDQCKYLSYNSIELWKE